MRYVRIIAAQLGDLTPVSTRAARIHFWFSDSSGSQAYEPYHLLRTARFSAGSAQAIPVSLLK